MYMDESVYINLKGLSRRLNVSPKTLRSWISEPDLQLPAYRVKGCLLFNWAEVERWLEKFRIKAVDIDATVDEILNDF